MSTHAENVARFGDKNPFLESLPTQLKVWDATALRLYQECPRKYQYVMVEGWRGKSNVHLDFGRLYHGAGDLFDKALAKGVLFEDALDGALEWLLKETYHVEEGGEPEYWGGHYVEKWRCTDEAKRKRCLYAKKAQIGAAPVEGICPKCSLPVTEFVEWENWGHDYKYKNRWTLVRSFIEYADYMHEHPGIKPYVFPDGRVASELSFNFDLPFPSPDGKPYVLAGNLDGLVASSMFVAVREKKTTKNTIDNRYFNRYNPDVQVDVYDMASHLLYGDTLKPYGIMVEATQVAVNFTRILRKFINIPPERRAEFLHDIESWILDAEESARKGYYRKNTAACSANGGCPFGGICRMAPSARHIFLPETFRREWWNPLQER